MSDTTQTSAAETSATMAGDSGVNWSEVVGADTAAAPAASGKAAAPAASLPDLPYVVGRLPIKCDTGKAIVRLPEAYKGVHCAAVFANVSVLSDCYKPATDVCRPAVKHARPLNDREIEVVFWGEGDGVVKGAGWKESGYPGAQLETRSIDFGVPFVEVLLVVSRTLTCGCDSDNWASDDGWQ